MGRPSATKAQQLLFRRAQVAGVGDGVHHRLHDGGVEHRPARGDGPHRPGQLVALGHVVLQQVRTPRRALVEQRDGVLGVVELRQDHDAGPGVPLADLVGGLDAFLLEVGGHPDVGHHHLGGELAGPVDELVVVGGGAHDLDVGLERQQGPHSFSHDEVVVGEEDADGGPGHAPIWPGRGATGQGCAPPPARGCQPVCRPSDPVPAPVGEHPPRTVVPGHAVHAAAGMGRGRAQVEALDRRGVAEPARHGPEDQLLVEGASSPPPGRRPPDWGSRARGPRGCAPPCPPPAPTVPGRGPRAVPCTTSKNASLDFAHDPVWRGTGGTWVSIHSVWPPAGARLGSATLCWPTISMGRAGTMPRRASWAAWAMASRSPVRCTTPVSARPGAAHGAGPSRARSTLKIPVPYRKRRSPAR